MPREILIYDTFNRWDTERIVSQLSEIEGDFSVRINSPGGSVVSGIAILSKLSEMAGGNKITVDGQAMSMGAFFLPFFKERLANDMSEFMLHKAAYPSWYEATAEEQERLLSLNNKIKQKMLDAGINAELVERVFRPDIREDVFLTAQEALEAGLITEIRELKTAEREALQAQYHAEAAASYQGRKSMPKIESQTPNKIHKMTIQELQAQHPALFAEAVEQGVKAERKRVGQFLAFVSTENEKTASGRAIKAIKDGDEIGDVQAEMIILVSAQARKEDATAENVKELAADGKKASPAATTQEATTPEAKKEDEMFTAVMAKLKGGE